MKVEDWTEIEDPLWENDHFIDLVLDKTSLIDILDLYNVEYSPCQTGDFAYRSKCPFPKHLDGGERTASLFISDEKNSFYCFGCNAGGNVIDFVVLYTGSPFHEVVKMLGKRAGIDCDTILNDTEKRKKRDPEKMVLTHVFRAGVTIRDHLSTIKGQPNYYKWCAWADKQFTKLDKLANALDDSKWEIAKKYHDGIQKYLRSKHK